MELSLSGNGFVFEERPVTGMSSVVNKERVQISQLLSKKLAQAVCGDDHLVCSWPICGCAVTKRKINAVVLVVSEIVVRNQIIGFDANSDVE